MNYPTLKEQIAGRCVHFNGIQNKACEAGVNYDQFAGKLPCLKSRLFSGQNRPAAHPCDKQQFPSDEQVAKELAEHAAAEEKFMKLTPLLREMKAKHRKTGFSGVVECPVCKGKLSLGVSSYNGHTRGKCETKDCLAWIE